MDKKQLQIKLSGVVLLVGLLALPTSVLADEMVMDTTTYCTSTGQICDPAAIFDVTTTGEPLQLNYTVADTHCSAIKLNVSVDGNAPISTVFLGWNGDPDMQPLDTGIIDLGVFSAGAHQISLQAEGKEGGCNAGDLSSWGGTVHILGVIPTPVLLKQPVGGTLTAMSSNKGTVTCQNLSTKQKIKFALPKTARDWNCEAQGLIVNSGDKIQQSISVSGKAD